MEAGHCASCEANVWLNEHGECEVGGSEHLIDTRWEVDDSALPLGKGPLPLALQKFCWPAFFMPVLWPLVHGFGWLVGTLLLVNVLALFLLPSLASNPTYFSTAQTMHSVVVMAASLWLGVKGNDIYWQRRKSLPAGKPVTVADYARAQRVWFWIGLVIFGYNAWMLRFEPWTLALLFGGSVAIALVCASWINSRPSRALVASSSSVFRCTADRQSPTCTGRACASCRSGAWVRVGLTSASS